MPSIFLVGFMASGKSSVGQALANELDLPFVDLDRRIEAGAKTSVSEVFARAGEEGFRELEAAALADVAAAEPSVVATGGGAPCHGDNLERMRAAGWVVHLAVPLEVALARAEADTAAERPLLGRPADTVRELHQRRQPIYNRAHATVDTVDRDVGDIARSIAACVRAVDRFPRALLGEPSLLALGDRSYPIVVDRGSLDRLGAVVHAAVPGARRVAIVSDENVAPLYAARARSSLEQAGLAVCEITIAAGETSKSFAELGRVIGELIAGGLDRSSAVVALGGGVVGDLAGFAAATLYRGIAVVQVPTTLVAMTDSAIGGKTGVNTPQGKNLVGAFWQPAAVVADPDVLATLPLRERRAAFGELVKYGLLDGDDLYDAIDAAGPALTAPVPALGAEVADLVRRCAGVKAAVVGADERERGLRAVLNLGHTVGHAIEASAGYGQLLHGEAVALGLVAAARLSARLHDLDRSLEDRIVATLERAGLDADVDPWLRDDVLARIGVDKKRTASRIRFVTVAAPGDVRLTDIELGELVSLLRQ